MTTILPRRMADDFHAKSALANPALAASIYQTGHGPREVTITIHGGDLLKRSLAEIEPQIVEAMRKAVRSAMPPGGVRLVA